MPLLGRNGAILLGKQTAIGTKQTTPIQKVFQTSGGGIGPVAEFGQPDLNDGSLAPGRPVIGQAGNEGSLQIVQDSSGLGVLLEALMLADATSAAYHAARWDIVAAAAYTSNTPITTFVTGSQPKAKLQDSTFVTAGVIKGVNAARLRFTFASSPALGTNPRLVIRGFDQAVSEADATRKRPVTEIIPLVAASLTTPFFSSFYYSEITSITVENMTTPGTLQVEGDASALYKHEIEIGDLLTNGYTVEAILGGSTGVPNTFIDVHVAQGSFTVGEFNEFDLGLQGGQFFLRENVAGGTTPTDFSSYTRPTGNVAAGWGTVLFLNDKFYRCGEAGFDINHNLGDDENPYARDPYRPAPLQTDKREVTVSARINLENDADHDFDQFAWGQDVKVLISSASMDFGAPNAFMNIEFPNCRLTEFPMPSDVPTGQIPQQITASAYRKGSVKEAKVTVVNSENATAFGG